MKIHYTPGLKYLPAEIQKKAIFDFFEPDSQIPSKPEKDL